MFRLIKKLFLALGLLFLAALAVFSVSVNVASAADNQTTYARVFVVNSLPVVDIISISPDPANPSDTMTVIANVTDANGDLDFIWAEYYNTTGGLIANVSLVYNATSGLYYNDSFTLAGDAEPGTWNVTVTANDTYGTASDSETFIIQGLVAIELINSPIDFGNSSAGEVNRRADNGTAGNGYTGGAVKGFPLQINNTGNVNEDYSISGLDLMGQSDSNYNITVGNVEYNTSNSGSGTSLTTLDTQFSATNAPESLEDVYFWIDVPAVPQQEYKGNVTIRATQSS